MFIRCLSFFTLISIATSCTLDEITSSTNYNISLHNWNGDQLAVANKEYQVEGLIRTDNPSGNLSGILVKFSVLNGDGKINGSTTFVALTDSAGVATGTWKLGDDLFKQNTLVASISDVNSNGETVSFELTPNHFLDQRDQSVYGAVRIANKIWMAENLNYAAAGVCYDNALVTCDTYGRLYSWEEQTGVKFVDSNFEEPIRGICPEGWVLPTVADFSELRFLYTEYGLMCCPELWLYDSGMTNDSRFNLKPGGDKGSNGAFRGLGFTTSIWTSSKQLYNGNQSPVRYGLYTDDGINHYTNISYPESSYSCRCIKE